MSGRNPPSYCTFTTLTAMQGHQQKGRHQTIKTNPIQSLKRAQQRTMMMRIFIIQVHDPVIHLEVDEEQCRRSHKEVRGKRKELWVPRCSVWRCRFFWVLFLYFSLSFVVRFSLPNDDVYLPCVTACWIFDIIINQLLIMYVWSHI